MIDYILFFAIPFFIFTNYFYYNKNKSLKNELINNNYLNIEILNFNDFYDIHIKNIDKNNLLHFLQLLKLDDESIKILNENNLFKKIV
jgi:hypothetical protein